MKRILKYASKLSNPKIISLKDTPRHSATSIASIAFKTLCLPAIGRVNTASSPKAWAENFVSSSLNIILDA